MYVYIYIRHTLALYSRLNRTKLISIDLAISRYDGITTLYIAINRSGVAQTWLFRDAILYVVVDKERSATSP